MTDFQPLLQARESFVAGVLRASLVGLAETLKAARDQTTSTDPGRAACDRLIAELTAELSGSDRGTAPSPAVNRPPAPVVEASGSPTDSRRLGEVRRAFLLAPEVMSEAPGIDLPDGDDSTFYLPLQFALLRLSSNVAKDWRERVKAAMKKAYDPKVVDILPGDADQLVVPGFAGVKGLMLSPKAPLDTRLGFVPPGPAETVARTLTVLLWMIDHDESLYHGLRGIYNFGLIRLQGEHRTRYVAALMERWAAFRDAVRGHQPDKALEAWVDLDEAIHSLQHNPPATLSSWWAKLQRQARDTVILIREEALAARHAVQLWEMSGRYSDSRRYTDEDDQPMPGSVPVGDIVICLRLYLEIDGRILKGRVFYRSR